VGQPRSPSGFANRKSRVRTWNPSDMRLHDRRRQHERGRRWPALRARPRRRRGIFLADYGAIREGGALRSRGREFGFARGGRDQLELTLSRMTAGASPFTDRRPHPRDTYAGQVLSAEIRYL
jgi:hypothetical protein